MTSSIHPPIILHYNIHFILHSPICDPALSDMKGSNLHFVPIMHTTIESRWQARRHAHSQARAFRTSVQDCVHWNGHAAVPFCLNDNRGCMFDTVVQGTCRHMSKIVITVHKLCRKVEARVGFLGLPRLRNSCTCKGLNSTTTTLPFSVG